MTTPAQRRRNLAKLAAYLESLPEGYEHFDMEVYLNKWREEVRYASKPQAVLAECGTVACALGHGPAAGIKVSSDYISHTSIDWHSYSKNFVSEQLDNEWHFLFSGSWSLHNNTPQGAAKRIRWLLAGNEPLEVGDMSYAESQPNTIKITRVGDDADILGSENNGAWIEMPPRKQDKSDA